MCCFYETNRKNLNENIQIMKCKGMCNKISVCFIYRTGEFPSDESLEDEIKNKNRINNGVF